MAKRDFGQPLDTLAWSEQLAGLMDQMLHRSFVAYRGSGVWQPATNVYESSSAFLISLELAGVASDCVCIECPDHRSVVVRGKRSQPRPADVPEALSIHILEIDEGPFYREIELPESVEVRALTWRFVEGLLWISVPKRPR